MGEIASAMNHHAIDVFGQSRRQIVGKYVTEMAAIHFHIALCFRLSLCCTSIP